MKVRSTSTSKHDATVPHLLVSMHGGVCSCGLSNPPNLKSIRASGKTTKSLNGSSNSNIVVNKK